MHGDVLMLNSDGLPVSVIPLSTISWQESIKALVTEKVDVLLWHDNWVVHSASWETLVPSVVMLREYMKVKSIVRYSRTNIYLRDEFRCQYCGITVDRTEATLDHVIPLCKGGRSTFENVVLSCHKCNCLKGDKLHHTPLVKPYKPDYYELVTKRKRQPFNLKHKEWEQFICAK